MIEITQQQIDRVKLILGGVQNASKSVFANVINRTLLTIRSQSGKHIRQTYRIKQQDITSNQNISVKRASGNGIVEGSIEYAGTLIPLIKFKVNPQTRQKAVSVSVLQQNSGKRLFRAYVTDLGRYGTGVFERQTSKRESSKQLMGPSTAHMIDNQNVLSKIEDVAMETIDKRVEHEINRILNGYGVR